MYKHIRGRGKSNKICDSACTNELWLWNSGDCLKCNKLLCCVKFFPNMPFDEIKEMSTKADNGPSQELGEMLWGTFSRRFGLRQAGLSYDLWLCELKSYGMRKSKEGILADISQGEEWVRRRRERNKRIQTKSTSGISVFVFVFYNLKGWKTFVSSKF